ncbi:predicted protein [Thalassiosira pseudonana CCMP1335]|uniref:Uncharacterized protein n=1 Tax=Thalassiosira pseudonana TaxID=35128 RepID=B8CD59_THAPS|nr:predicted protein [Thalassiosira pseudonana CCMP1335]EED88409.1 predicted protein [Thalassiosira pseudonana CCMP1335]|eukprot:g13468.t1 g13468   contig8:741144-741855(-)
MAASKSTAKSTATRLTQLALLLSCLIQSSAFVPSSIPSSSLSHNEQRTTTSSSALQMAEPFEMMVELPGRGEMSAKMKFMPVLDVPSEIVEVRYKVPFGLDVAPKNNMAICTKDGAGGEKVGDILRYTSQWTLGLPRGDGVITTAMSFSGGISWQVSMFDVMKAGRWEDVVEALVSNEGSRTDEVILLFERPIAGGEESS